MRAEGLLRESQERNRLIHEATGWAPVVGSGQPAG